MNGRKPYVPEPTDEGAETDWQEEQRAAEMDADYYKDEEAE